MAMMMKHVPAMEQEPERKMERKEGAPKQTIAAAGTASMRRKRTKQQIRVRMSQKLPPPPPMVEQSIPSPGEHFAAYE